MGWFADLFASPAGEHRYPTRAERREERASARRAVAQIHKQSKMARKAAVKAKPGGRHAK